MTRFSDPRPGHSAHLGGGGGGVRRHHPENSSRRLHGAGNTHRRTPYIQTKSPASRQPVAASSRSSFVCDRNEFIGSRAVHVLQTVTAHCARHVHNRHYPPEGGVIHGQRSGLAQPAHGRALVNGLLDPQDLVGAVRLAVPMGHEDVEMIFKVCGKWIDANCQKAKAETGSACELRVKSV